MSQLRIEDRPDGPLIRILQDGTVVVARGSHDECARLFWEAVQFNGATYRDQIEKLKADRSEMMKEIVAWRADPWRNAVSNATDVLDAIPKPERRLLTRGDVAAVLEAVCKLAMKGAN